MSHFKSILPIALGLVLVVGGYVSAWTGNTATPPACSGLEGCNPPINTGSTAQTKAGALTISGILTGSINAIIGGNLGMKSGSIIDFNSAGSGRTTPEGQIGYSSFILTPILNIYGGGASPNRKVVIYDQICSSPINCKSTSNIIAGGVTKIIAGTNVTISPTTGVGDVTVNAKPTIAIVGSANYNLNICSGGSVTASCATGYSAIGGACRSSATDGMIGSSAQTSSYTCYFGRVSGSCSGSFSGTAQAYCVKVN